MPVKVERINEYLFSDTEKLIHDCDDDEVLNALSRQGVVAVKRITVKCNGNTEATNTFSLTFALPTVPSAVEAAYMRIPVELYFPNPLRCF